LLSNIYLHWFDKVFNRKEGPAKWAVAKLVRYADDLVVLARYQSPRLTGWIEEKLETWMGLEINREKTRVVDLKKEGASLDFLGYTFRYEWDLHGGEYKYLNMQPSKKAMLREREELRRQTSRRMCHKPLPRMIAELNRHLKGWANYFGRGYPRKAFREINTYVQERLVCHLKQRSQRPFRPPKGTTYYSHFQKMGLVNL
jgi:RNA-directed DNA polymerase